MHCRCILNTCSMQVACHVTEPVITAGNTTVVVDSGGSKCDVALREICSGLEGKGAQCWNCTSGSTDPAGHAKLKAAGCDKGSFKSYCGPQLEGKLCNSGPYTCAYIEHFAAFAPAFGRRPYFGEEEGAVIIVSDFSFARQTLALSTVVAGIELFAGAEFEGGGSVRLPFSLARVPARHSEQ